MCDENMKYIVMWNLPGCMPEMDPAVFDTFWEAKEFLADEFDTRADYPLDIISDDWHEVAQEIRELNHATFVLRGGPDGYVYTIREAPEYIDEDYQESEDI